MYVLLTLSVIGILRRGGSMYAERIGRVFLEKTGAEILRRGMEEETHHRLRKQYVLPLGYNACGREGPMKCMAGRNQSRDENVRWDQTIWI